MLSWFQTMNNDQKLGFWGHEPMTPGYPVLGQWVIDTGKLVSESDSATPICYRTTPNTIWFRQKQNLVFGVTNPWPLGIVFLVTRIFKILGHFGLKWRKQDQTWPNFPKILGLFHFFRPPHLVILDLKLRCLDKNSPMEQPRKCSSAGEAYGISLN